MRCVASLLGVSIGQVEHITCSFSLLSALPPHALTFLFPFSAPPVISLSLSRQLINSSSPNAANWRTILGSSCRKCRTGQCTRRTWFSPSMSSAVNCPSWSSSWREKRRPSARCGGARYWNCARTHRASEGRPSTTTGWSIPTCGSSGSGRT